MLPRVHARGVFRGACGGVAIVTGAVFGWSGLAKLAHRDVLLRSLVTLPWLSVATARGLARWLPAVELGVAVLLLAAPGVGGPVALTALAVFTTVLCVERVAGRHFECACFGAARSPSSGRALARNGGLTLMTVAGLAALGPLVLTTGVIGALAAAALVVVAVTLRQPAVAEGRP